MPRSGIVEEFERSKSQSVRGAFFFVKGRGGLGRSTEKRAHNRFRNKLHNNRRDQNRQTWRWSFEVDRFGQPFPQRFTMRLQRSGTFKPLSAVFEFWFKERTPLTWGSVFLLEEGGGGYGVGSYLEECH